LRASNRYAAAITHGVRTVSGQPLAPANLLADLDGPWDPGSVPSRWARSRFQSSVTMGRTSPGCSHIVSVIGLPALDPDQVRCTPSSIATGAGRPWW